MQFLALTSIGIENLLNDEIQQLGGQVTKQSIGSVNFEADSITAQKICLCSRLSTRILMQIGTSEEIKNKTDLYQFCRFQPWQDWFGPAQQFLVDFSGTNGELKNTQFSALVIKDAVVDYFFDLFESRPSIDKKRPDVRIVARLNRQKLGLFIDYSGPSLSQRGYRLGQGKAPLKEHLAAALVIRSGWLNDTSKPLFDPCCGSGTLLIEAASMALNNAPGMQRPHFAFQSLPSFREVKFKELKNSLRAEEQSKEVNLMGHDNNPKVLDKARQNAQQAGFAEYIQFRRADASELTSVAEIPGTVLSNLPYGERLGGTAELIHLYRSMGAGFKQHFANWQLALFGMDDELFRLLKLAKKKQYKFKNGPLDCLLNLYQLDEKQVQQSASSTELNFNESSSFANRLKKNKKALKNWLKTQDIDCYRVYDADIPEYNVAVDVYRDHAVVFEYAAPKEIDAVTAQKRLQDVIYLVQTSLDIAPTKVAVKVREKQKGEKQYQSYAESKHNLVVNEYGAKFQVNLYDYLDTGLFLDHRLARHYIQKHAKGKKFLNLFAYTGSASVHAAIGGAKSVMTVDMSKTYLNWARENFELNNISGSRFRFEQADCIKWLEYAQGQYDLIFLDPPTFSNSKRMKNVFDVQRDHVDLLKKATARLSKTGTLIFSNNKRGFKMDVDVLAEQGIKVENISADTLSPDFKRNQKIHNCWLVRHG